MNNGQVSELAKRICAAMLSYQIGVGMDYCYRRYIQDRAELAQVPATLLTDPRVRWEPLDDESAVLVVPREGKGAERFVVRFDPTTNLFRLMEVMRYQRKNNPEKTLWVTEAVSWERFNGFMAGKVGTAWWYGASRPWALFRTEDLLLNAELGGYLRERGE